MQYLLLVCEDASRLAALQQQLGKTIGFRVQPVGDRVLLCVTRAGDLLGGSGPNGAIIGALFRRSGAYSRIDSIDAGWTARDDSRWASTISERHWGSYISCKLDPASVTVSRDPSGTLPCFYLRLPGAVAFASDVGLLLHAFDLKAEISWQDVARALYTKHLPTPPTSLSGVTELLPGTSIRLERGACRIEAYWSPWDHIPARPVEDFEHHAGILRDTIDRCVASLAGDLGSVLLGVSGGLDSSIVAASLVTAGAKPSGLTMTTDDPVGDERHHARELCAHLAMPLQTAPYLLADIDVTRSSVAHLPRPCGRTEALGYDAAVHRAVTAGGFGAFFNGSGGDNVFFLSRSARALADAWLAKGAGKTVWRTALDLSSLTGVNLWQISREALRFTKTGRRRYSWDPLERFLHPDVIAGQRAMPVEHPWLDAPPDALPGKAAHVAFLLRMQPFVACQDRSLVIPTFNPIVAQPIVEACLAIPSWLMCRQGQDRAVARAAYASALPPSIVQRRSKGGPDGFAIDLLTRSLPLVRARLLRGRLATAGLLDLDGLDRSLHAAALSRSWDYPRILSLLDAEAWVEHWQGFSPASRAVAALHESE